MENKTSKKTARQLCDELIATNQNCDFVLKDSSVVHGFLEAHDDFSIRVKNDRDKQKNWIIPINEVKMIVFSSGVDKDSDKTNWLGMR